MFQKVCLWLGVGILYFILLSSIVMLGTLHLNSNGMLLLFGTCIITGLIIYFIQVRRNQFVAIAWMIWAICNGLWMMNLTGRAGAPFLGILSGILCVIGTWRGKNGTF